MRRLKFKDLGKASKIIKKLQLRADRDMAGQDLETLGASLFLKLAENYSAAQEDIADFMSGLLEDEGVTKEAFLEKELDEVFGYFEALKEDEGLSRFLSMLSKMTETTTN